MLRTNPCQFVELPKKQRYESSYYSADQLKTLFDAIRDDPIYPLVKITAEIGPLSMESEKRRKNELAQKLLRNIKN